MKNMWVDFFLAIVKKYFILKYSLQLFFELTLQANVKLIDVIEQNLEKCFKY